ncbi:MAG: PQQ-binding-like beta-propeller repeat protein [Candidatus Bathyarchaeota archaeon]|nr:PQQ-binding-like beta-propeller repeat protein [Candidatus Bathyarchaeota archaeon]
MNKKPISLLILAILLSSLPMPFIINGAKADAPINVTINPDGSIIPSSDVISTSDQVTYTLTQDFYGSINIQRSNIIFDGSNHTITGSGSTYGIYLASVNSVTVKNTVIRGGFQLGINLVQASNNIIKENTIESISLNSINSGILVQLNSNNNTVRENQVIDCFSGIYVEGSDSICSDNTIFNNIVTVGTLGIKFANGASNNRAIDNQITGGVYGFIFDVAGSNNAVVRNTIRDTHLEGGTSAGIMADYTYTTNVIAGNTLQNNTQGLDLYDCSGFRIYANNFIDNNQQVAFENNIYTNDWNYSGQGNYWSDYLTRYPEATEDSGIWDTPYILENSAPNIDYYPLVNPANPAILDIIVTGSGSTEPNAGVYCEIPDTTIEVSQTPVNGGEFYNWILDDVNYTRSTISVVMDTDHTLIAAFKSITYSLTIETSNNGHIYSSDTDGIVDGTTVALPPDSTYEVYAKAQSGYIFSYWLLDGEEYSSSRSITIQFDGDHTLQAVFIPSPIYILPGQDAHAPTTNKLLWSFDTGASIYRTPTIVNGVVYTVNDDGVVYAINATTDMPIWSFSTNDCIYSSPVVVDGVVYVCTEGGYVYALNATTINANGKVVWSYNTEDDLELAPVVVDGVVYVASYYGSVYAFNANPSSEEGELLWNFVADGYVYSNPTAVDGAVYFATDDGYVHALNAQSGEPLWAYQTNDYMDGSPAVDGGVVYVSTEGGSVYALAVTTENSDGVCLWAFDTYSAIYCAPVVVDGVVYVCTEDGYVYAFNATTQNPEGEVIWSYYTDDYFYDTPTVADGVVYATSDNGYIYALAANTENPEGELLWAYSSDDYFRSPVIVADGAVYATANSGYVYALNANPKDTEGELIWTYQTGGRINCAPVYADGVLYATARDGCVYAFADNSKIVFTAEGLKEGDSWSVTFDGITQTSPVNVITFVTCKQGQFSYTITPPEGYTSVSLSETLDVSDSDIAIPVVFTSLSPKTYNVVFTESGLALGTNWSVTFDGTTQNSTTDTIIFSGYADGTYNYTVTTPAGYSTTTNSGTVTVADGDVSQKIAFTQNQYALTVNTVGEGCNVTINPAQDSYTYGASVQLTPVAGSGWVFSGWNGDLTGTDNPVTITMDSDKIITATFEKTNTIIATKTSDNQTYLITLGGNITAQQMANMTITPYEDNATTTIAFIVTGPSGTEGIGTITLPKTAIPYGTTPQVYIDGALAENQSYTQDDENYYITYSTHFSTHIVTIIFVSPQQGTQLTFTQRPPTYQCNITVSQTSTIEPTPTPPEVTPPPTATPTPAPTIAPTPAGIPDYVVLIAAVIALIAVALGIIHKRKSNKWR